MKVTVDEVLREGNWQAAAWEPRLADEAAFREFVQTVIQRAAAQVEWRVGRETYADAEEPLASILKEAEQDLAQETLLLAAADLAESAGEAAPPPFHGAGADLRRAAASRRARAQALLAPYEQSTGQPEWRQPAAGAGGPLPAVRKPFRKR